MSFFGQADQQLEGFVGDAILRVIEIEAQGFGRKTATALGILCKELSQMRFTDLFVVRPELSPCVTFDRWAAG
jgi:hypothetical protein